MKIAPLLLLLATLTPGCSTHKRVVVHPVTLPFHPSDGLRYPEIVRAYHLGRRIGPGNLLHEAHPIYRIEAEARWDLAGRSGPMPRQPWSDSAWNPPPLNDAIQAELHRQQDVTRGVMLEAARLSQAYEDLRKAILSMTSLPSTHSSPTTPTNDMVKP